MREKEKLEEPTRTTMFTNKYKGTFLHQKKKKIWQTF